MTNEEKAALKARFKAGSIPSESDYGALIDKIDSSSSSSELLVIPADVDLRNKVMERVNITNTQYTFTNPYTYTTIPELLDAYSVITGTDVKGVKQVIISNESWDSAITMNESEASWNDPSAIYIPPHGGSSSGEYVWSSYSAYISTSTGELMGTSYPMFILTDHTTMIPAANEDDVSSYGGFYGQNEYLSDEDKIVDAIQRGRALMFIKRTRAVKGNWYPEEDSEGNYYYYKTFHYWVPVNRGTTVTTYELGQMYQDFEANPHPDSGGSSS